MVDVEKFLRPSHVNDGGSEASHNLLFEYTPESIQHQQHLPVTGDRNSAVTALPVLLLTDAADTPAPGALTPLPELPPPEPLQRSFGDFPGSYRAGGFLGNGGRQVPRRPGCE